MAEMKMASESHMVHSGKGGAYLRGPRGKNMPAVSKAQATAMRIAEHAPEKLYAKNKGMLKMSHSQLHDFAKTKSKGLPKHVKTAKLSSLARAK